MTTAKRGRAASYFERLTNGWGTFWFSVDPAYTLGFVRMAFGALMVYVTLDLLPRDAHPVQHQRTSAGPAHCG